ncbi:MAG TPA: twin-arginine translocase TatA/TatE family subunit [Candidatus Deferrimicrobium sp.]|nr:twin-arginine translocase TatA/TatE family subunit [Candidatus Deferrimicrobium sp.]
MSLPELFFILVLALILFGPEELPKIARTIGKTIYEIKKATSDVQQEVRKVVMEQPTKPPIDMTTSIDNLPEQEIITEKQN